MIILGLGGLQGNGACAVLKDGTIVAAIEESELSRGMRGGVPQAAVAECLRLAGVDRDAVDCVAVVRPVDPSLHFSLRELFPKAEVAVVEHHLAHAASAFFASPFESATVLTLDHTGDFGCGARWQAQGNQLQLEKEWQYPDSLAWLYSAVTELLGFHAGADEHKVQWLSASGDDRFYELFHEIAAASGRLDATFFDGHRSASGGFSAKFFERLGLEDGAAIPPALAPALAHGLQRAVEDTVLAMAGEGENLCVAGGLFFNALLVEFLEHSGRWKNVFVQPAAGNSGTALGGAFHVWYQRQQHTHRGGATCLLLGPSYGREEIKKVLENCKLRFQYLRSTDDVLAKAVRMLGERKIRVRGCRAVWNSVRARSAIAASWRRHLIHIRLKTSTSSSSTANRSANSRRRCRRSWRRSTSRLVPTRAIWLPWATREIQRIARPSRRRFWARTLCAFTPWP